jgi:hypothetical protein
MKLLLATNRLGLGGSESYLLTVGEQFDRLGHEVTVYSPEGGAGEALARERDLALAGEADSIAADYDAAVIQDAAVAHEIAERCPEAPQLFVAHSDMFDLQTPPQLPAAVAAVVALNERVAARMRSFATEVEVVRLRQPIDTLRFTPRSPLPEVPRRALLLSNTPHADRLEMIESACAKAGLELRRRGGVAGDSTDIRPDLVAAEIVIGYGRSILEAMACGRAAYVYDWQGGDGWVTRESYEEIEAGGFGGRTGRLSVDRDSLSEDLGRYSASMGPVNHDLAVANHRAGRHAEQLVELLRSLGDRRPSRRDAPREMARLVRLEWRAQLDVHALRRENATLAERLHESELARSREYEEHAREIAEAAAEVESRVRGEYEGSLSWRLTTPLRVLLRRLRGSK